MALIESRSRSARSVSGSGSIESHGSLALASACAPRPGTRSERTPRRLWEKLRASVWAPVLARALGVVLGMLGLASIGAFATAKGLPGHAVAHVDPTASGSTPVSRQGASGAAPPMGRAALTPEVVAHGANREAGRAPAQETPENTKPSPGVTEDGKIILNLATVADLQRLPGVGKKRAESILALREKLGGRFRRFTDLLRIRGIGPRRLKQMIPLMVLDPPAPKPPASAGAPPTPSASARSPTPPASSSATP